MTYIIKLFDNLFFLKRKIVLWLQADHSFESQWRIGKLGMLIQAILTIAVVLLAHLSHRKQIDTRDLIAQSHEFAIQAEGIHATSQEVRYEQLRLLQDYQRLGIIALADNAPQRQHLINDLESLRIQVKNLENNVAKIIDAINSNDSYTLNNDTSILDLSKILSRRLELFINLDSEFIAKLYATRKDVLEFQYQSYEEIQVAGVNLDKIALELSKRSSSHAEHLTKLVESRANLLFIGIILFSMVSLCWNAALLFLLSRSMKSNLGLVKRISKLANSDPLTGLLNRRALNIAFKTIEVAFTQTQNNADTRSKNSRKNGAPPPSACLMLIDLDFFKRFNDTFGHVKGDEHLKKCAAIWKENVRSRDFVSRMGGEEFAVLMPYCDELQAYITAERLQKNMPANTSFSAGIALLLPNESFTQLYKRADKALYLAKTNGRSQAVIYSQIPTQEQLRPEDNPPSQIKIINPPSKIIPH